MARPQLTTKDANKPRKEWTFKAHGFDLEIVNWGFDAPSHDETGGVWNAYVTMTAETMPVEQFIALKQQPVDDCSDSDLSKLPWHGGITFLEFRDTHIKAGMDYNHLVDQGRRYELGEVIEDITRVALDLRNRLDNPPIL